MRTTAASEPGTPGRANEDWHHAGPDLVVVLDGATARTDTGCVHGVAWYAARLGEAVVRHAYGGPLPDALAAAIKDVTALHPSCDLGNAATPGAAVAVLRHDGPDLDYLVLGDVAVVLDTVSGLQTIVDDRVSATAKASRDEADRWPIGSAEKAKALLEMKSGELAARNREGGFWTASTDPTAADHALTGHLPAAQVTRAAVATDGATRAVTFGLVNDWAELLNALAETGPATVITQVRDAERADPDGRRWPRNKASDDATAVYAGFHLDHPPGRPTGTGPSRPSGRGQWCQPR